MPKQTTKKQITQQKTASEPKKSLWLRARTATLLVIVGILLTIAQTGWWVSHTIYDTDTFAKITTTALTTESSREAIANEIVSQSFKSKPVLQATLGKSATKLVSSLLATDQAANAITKVSEKAQTILTSDKPDPIVFNLVPLKKGLVVISAIAERVDKPIEVNAVDIPDSIVLLNRNEIPDLYKLNQKLLFLTPLCIFISVALLGYLLYSGREKIYKVLLQIGIMLTAVSIIGLATGPLIRPPVLSLVGKANARIVLGNLYDGFMAPFTSQMTSIGIIGIVIILFASIQLGVIGATIRKIRHSSN